MPQLGIPAQKQQNSLQSVQIAPRPAEEKSKIDRNVLEKATGENYGRQVKTGDLKTHNQVGKDEFLKLLTHQLQNQDPTSPMDQNKFAADLAQFSQLEQLTNLNSKFDGMNTNSNMEKKALGASFVGKKVVTSGSSLELSQDGERKNVVFNLDKNADKVKVRILDSKNNIVRELDQSQLTAGSHSIDWDGKAMDGYPAGQGNYTVSILAYDENSSLIPVTTQVSGVVDSVVFDGDEPILNVGNRKVYLRDVSGFFQAGDKGPDVKAESLKGGLNKYKAVGEQI